jgi:hypothetical protein
LKDFVFPSGRSSGLFCQTKEEISQMIRYSKHVAKLSAIAAAVLAAPAFAAITMDANLELDTDYRSTIDSATALNPRVGGISQGGRVEFNVSGKAGDANGFVAGKGTLLIKRDGSTGADDMWGQIGTGMADVKLGRFEATDMFPPGKDVLVENGANTLDYRMNSLRGRTSSTNGVSPLHAALTINPGSGLSFELGIIETKEEGALKGIRPVVAFAAGPVTVKVGAEIGQTNGFAADPTTVPPTPAFPALKFNGFGATVGGSLEGVGFNVNLATSKIKATAVSPEIKSTNFGANATFGPAGVGVVFDKFKSAGVKIEDTVIYAAYSIPLFNTGAELTPAISHQTGKVGGTSLESATALRVRLNYKF